MEIKVKFHNNDLFHSLMAIILVMGIPLIGITSWLTHVIVCIKTGAWGLLIAGGLIFPVGMIHGIGLWFGAW